jgi:transcriptional regulator with XRE-family HTH domain
MEAVAVRRNPIDKRVGGRVRMKRIALGLTLQELVDEVGVTVVELQRFEAGFDRIDAKILLRLSKALAVTPAFFFG